MRITIFSKLALLLAILIIVPLVVVSFLSLDNAKKIGNMATNSAIDMGKASLDDSTKIITDLGASIIKEKAVDVAKQIDIYLRAHPKMSITDLQIDPYFSAIAVQPVGKTGYTALTDVDTLTCRFHSSPKIINLDLSTLAGKLPGFWSVMSKSRGGQETEGYYDWLEIDGSVKQKYMYIAMTDEKTGDGVRLSVAATTYIDEFSSPVKLIKSKNASAVAGTLLSIQSFTGRMYDQNIILLFAILIVAMLAGFISARSLSRPIKKLKQAADQATMGNFDVKLPEVKGTDEVAELTASIEMLIAALKLKK